MPLVSGHRFGPYVIGPLLGSGGMGEVYRAFDERLRRDVALKLIAPRLGQDGEVVDRFIREALAVSALNHPNIITIYEAGETAEGRYIVMEFVRGRTLRELTRQGVPFETARELTRQVAEALAVAHASQIVHRDVKPDNVMVRDDGYVKVLDFGLARLVRSEDAAESTLTEATRSGLVLGTIGYMSPEQARGETLTPASDVFALGILLYELLAGQHPFQAASPLAVLHGILADAPVAPSRLGIEVPPALEQLVLECLQKDFRLRPTAGEVAARLRGVVSAAPALTPRIAAQAGRHLVGRDSELEVLTQAYAQAAQGHGEIIAVAGEPGLGKTALVDEFLSGVADLGQARVARGRCSERLAGSEAYLPFLELLDSILRSESHGSLARVLKTVAPNWYVQAVSSPEHDSSTLRALSESGAGSPQRMKREMTAFLEEASRLQPAVLFLDDVQWADGATVDLLAYLADRLGSMRLLLVVAYRPSEVAQSRHPFLPVKLELQARGICRELPLFYLSEAAVGRYVAMHFPEHTFPDGFIQLVHRRTEGHALFLVDLLRDLRRRKLLVQDGQGHWVLAEGLAAVERSLPESVRSMIQRTVDALTDDDRLLLGAAAVQGSDFHSAVIAEALELPEEQVEDRLDRLEREHALIRFAGEVTCPDRTVTLRYRFSHALYQHALGSALRATRRATLAGALAAALVKRWADRTPEIALELALLFESARASMAAARYFSVAAQAASRLFAHEEAERLASRGLALLHGLADDRARRAVELELQMTYALSVKTCRGYAVPEVGQAYRRARDLARQIDDPGLAIPVLMGLSAHYVAAGDIRVAHELAAQLLEIATAVGNPHVRMIAEWCLGAALHHLGQLRDAHEHLERGLALYDPAFHRTRAWEVGIEPGIFCLCETTRTLSLLGRPDAALERSRQADAQARALGHPQTLAFVLLFRMLLHHLRDEPAEARLAYDELAALCAERGIAQEMLWARPVFGWILFEEGEQERGLQEMATGIADQAATNTALLRPYYLLLHADALKRSGRFDEARQALDAAAATSFQSAQHMFEPELHRLRGELLMAEDGASRADARAALEQAVTEARRQGARMLEQRALASLARL